MQSENEIKENSTIDSNYKIDDKYNKHLGMNLTEQGYDIYTENYERPLGKR